MTCWAAPIRYAAALLICLGLGNPLQAQALYDVLRVVDGDTIVLRDVGAVRLIGVDAPEPSDPRTPVQRSGVEAAAFLRRLVGGSAVRLEFDTERTDRYQRTLAYLYLPDGTFVNRELVRQGYAHAYVAYPFRYLEEFRALEAEARRAGRGLWNAGRTQPGTTAAPQQVWVNLRSRVYHCPGTRYYGNTARGAYMDEAEAVRGGHRPAYGRRCTPAHVPAEATEDTDGTPAGSPRVTAPAASAPPPDSVETIRVWVNTSSGVYHCPGTRYYGSTKRGTYMSQGDARARGYRPAAGRACS